MPAISMFLGILIRMYYKDHHPPHFHADYGEANGIFEIESCEMIKGDLRKKEVRYIQAWAELHKEELKANWELAKNGESPFRIRPLD